MTALATAPIIADDVEYYEVRDLLSGEVIGRITAHRVRADGPLRRALEKHGFRLVAADGSMGTPQPRLTKL